MDILSLNLLAGWLGVLAGLVSGAAIGMFYHQDEWMGGYSSFRRRMVRLGHISFFGLGFVNLMFAFSLHAVDISPPEAQLASGGFILGLISMPLCCFLCAWRKPFRHLFLIPILGVLTGIIALLKGWPIR